MHQYLTSRLSSVKKIQILHLLLNGYRLHILILMLMLPAFKLQAQDFFPEQRDYGVRAGVDFEKPGKNLEGYQAAPAYNIGFLKFYDHVTVGVNMSYREFKPKAPEMVEEIAGSQLITTYSNYSAFLFYLDVAYNYQVAERVNFYGAINGGLGYNSFSVNYKDYTSDIYVGGGGKQIYLAPKLGLVYAINNSVEMDFHAAYHVLTQGGSQTYNSRSGTTGSSSPMYTAISAGVGLVFKF